MHPAVSVIFFTVTSGAGFGMIFLLGLGMPLRDGVVIAVLTSGLAIGLSVAGLVSSTFHLGHPERAWRAFSQWRSSWLSREGVLAAVTLVLFAAYAFVWVFYGERIRWLGWLAAIFAVATVFATAMIYAQLKTVPSWNSRWTPACYLFFALSSAVLGLGSFSNADQTGAFANLAIGVLLLSWAAKMKWSQRAEAVGMAGSSTETATGLGDIGKVKLLEKPHSGENYLTKEMVHQIGRKHSQKLRRFMIVCGGLLPLTGCFLILIVNAPAFAFFPCFLAFLVGLFAERWLFFAEAKHSVSLYY